MYYIAFEEIWLSQPAEANSSCSPNLPGFLLYFKANGPNHLHFLCKILLQTKFIAKSIFDQ